MRARRWGAYLIAWIRLQTSALMSSQQTNTGFALAAIPSTRSVHVCTYPTWLCPRCFAFLFAFVHFQNSIHCSPWKSPALPIYFFLSFILPLYRPTIVTICIPPLAPNKLLSPIKKNLVNRNRLNTLGFGIYGRSYEIPNTSTDLFFDTLNESILPSTSGVPNKLPVTWRWLRTCCHSS